MAISVLKMAPVAPNSPKFYNYFIACNGIKLMTNFKIAMISIICVTLFIGCVNKVEIDMAANMKIVDDPFKSALQKEYIKLAHLRHKEGDVEQTRYFINKAKTVAKSEHVLPQLLGDQKLPDHAKSQLAEARITLVNKLWNGGSNLTPKFAARAHAMFDCWITEQGTGEAAERIRICRKAFQAALYDIRVREKMVKSVAEINKVRTVPMPAPYIVYFGVDSTEIDHSEMIKIKRAFADFRLRKPSKIIIVGHADSSGSKGYNMELSRHRAAEVSNQLMELGVPREIIKRSRYGESAPLVSTSDNKLQSRNRRVSITFLP